MDEERSESGSPIYRHKARDEQSWTPPNMEDNSIDAISDHIEKHIGPIAMVWHELISDLVHIDVYQIAPTEDRPFWTLVTSGMSDLPMKAPEGREAFRFAELMICLPKEWGMKEPEFKLEENYWPVRWLKMMARFPHEYNTWLSYGHTIPNGDPASPFHESVPFECMMLALPRTVSTEFWELPIRNDKMIRFFALMPLYPGEVALKLKQGAEAVERLFERHKISEIVNPIRRDVAQKEWWKFW